MTANGVAGHFGEWIQGRLGPDGPVVLISLPCPVLRARLDPDGVSPPFAHSQISEFCQVVGSPPTPLRFHYDMPLGGGCGASTATLVAIARAAGYAGTPEQLAKACVAIEGASDPLMFARPERLLWASRRAESLAALPAIPACEIIGGFWGAPCVTDPGDVRFADVDDLVNQWCRVDHLAAFAALATRSADRHDALMGVTSPMPGLARELGALGHLRAHTGSARALVFDPGKTPPDWAERLRMAGLGDPIRFTSGSLP